LLWEAKKKIRLVPTTSEQPFLFEVPPWGIAI
jgi:hypothetical protein